jgi:hypothetical protein
MSKKEDDKESKEPDYDNDRDQLEENQEQETGEQEATSNASLRFLKVKFNWPNT